MKNKISKFVLAASLLLTLPLAACGEQTNQSKSNIGTSSVSSDSGSSQKFTRNYQGEGEPNANLGDDGDTYTDTVTGDTYKKADGKWTKVYVPQALTGEGEPADTLGNDGDTYTDTISGAIYEKKNGHWVCTKDGDEVFSVSFNLNGGKFPDGTTECPTQFVRIGRWATQPPIDPIKEHCEFEGWFATGSSTAWNFIGGQVYGNIELTAHWRVKSEDKLTVTVDPNNGDAKYTVETYAGDYLYPSAPSNPGYSFMGWYVKSTDEKFNGYVTLELADETLIAKWEVASFNVTFQVESNNEVTITGILNINSVSVDIPSTVAGRKVTKIAKTAFNSRIYLETVYIPASVKTIEEGAFRGTWRLVTINVDSANTNYTTRDGILYTKDMKTLVCYPTKAGSSFTLPDGVTKIGAYAFYDSLDMGISTINFNNELQEIGDYAFYLNETISSVTFPKTLRKIGKSAFFGNTYTDDESDYSSPEGVLTNIGFNEGLEEIGPFAFANQYMKDTFELPSTVKSIGEYCFVNCTAITQWNVNKSLESIGYNAFAGCTGILKLAIGSNGNNNFAVQDSILYTKDMKTLVLCPSGRTEKVTVPNGVTALGDCAFYMCDELQEYEFPTTLKTFGKECFAQTYHLNSFTIPDSVTSIGVDCFYCSGVSSVTFGTGLTEIPSGSFDSTGLTSVSIPGNVKVIRDSAFSFSSSLKTLTLAEGVEEIEDGAFYKTAITALDMPNSLKSIGARAFGNCKITTLDVKNGLEEIGENAFLGSDDTTTITNITVGSSNTRFATSGNILYSKDGKKIYFAAKNIGVDGTYNMPGGVETIMPYAFARITSITSITFPSSLKEIGEGAFMYSKCKSLSFGSNLKTIGEGAFYFTYATEVKFSEGIEEIGPYAFNMSDLKSVTLPDSLKKVGKYAFCQTLMMKTLVLGNGLEEVGDFAFACSRLECEITIPASLTKIGEGAFTSFVSTYGSQLSDIKVANGNTAFKSQDGFLLSKDGKKVYAFAPAYGYGLTESAMHVPNGVEEIMNYAISGSREAAINVLTLPTSLKTIGDYAFQGLCYITKLTVPSSVEYIGERAFESWTSKQSITLPLSEENSYIAYHQFFLTGCNATVKFGA